RDIKVVPLPDALFTVKCESCGSEFFVGDGFGLPSKGEAKESLKKYKTSLSSGDMLYVFR
ncbi:MAG: hypothetical protein LBN23_02585, partial [Paludibacter sp.]|nr:hypothetical protein [Paludibacter sp.]